MDLANSVADLSSFAIQEAGALLFGLVFLFIWRQSKVVYFGLWAAAWLLRFIAAFFSFELMRTGHAGWLAPYAVFEYAFVIVLISAARAGFASAVKDWRTVLRLIAILPVFVALVWAIGRYASFSAYEATHALVLSSVYGYNMIAVRRNAGAGARVFRFSLLMLTVAFIVHAVVFFSVYHSGAEPGWARFLPREAYYDFALHCVLAFAAMAMWSESQMDRVHELHLELENARRDSARGQELDTLTGLLNQSALARRVEEVSAFHGSVVVCDMDNFKEINDSFGHLIGDEILRNVGNLLHASIRHQDEAFRWGGDEFVILFHDQLADAVSKRMTTLEGRLRNFRVRGAGALPISFSWGATEGAGRPLREALDEADHRMYALKRQRFGGPAEDRPLS
jgi:diguanylate cyclase (GGDEF)-like protein